LLSVLFLHIINENVAAAEVIYYSFEGMRETVKAVGIQNILLRILKIPASKLFPETC
jgi:hypothetical protein